MTVAPLAEDYFTAVRAEVERRLLLGMQVPGFGLELGRKGARKFTDEGRVEVEVVHEPLPIKEPASAASARE